jgi:hypothetical protein
VHDADSSPLNSTLKELPGTSFWLQPSGHIPLHAEQGHQGFNLNFDSTSRSPKKKALVHSGMTEDICDAEKVDDA